MNKITIIFGMLLFTVIAFSQKRIDDDKSYFIEKNCMNFIGMEHNVKSMNTGITYKFILTCVLVEYESNETYYDDFGVPTKTKYMYVTDENQVVGLKNWRYLYPIYKHKSKNIIVVIDRKYLENECASDRMKLRIIENEINKNELFLIYEY